MSTKFTPTEVSELITEVDALFAEGWCVCRSSSLPQRLHDALESTAADLARAREVIEKVRTAGKDSEGDGWYVVIEINRILSTYERGNGDE